MCQDRVIKDQSFIGVADIQTSLPSNRVGFRERRTHRTHQRACHPPNSPDSPITGVAGELCPLFTVCYRCITNTPFTANHAPIDAGRQICMSRVITRGIHPQQSLSLLKVNQSKLLASGGFASFAKVDSAFGATTKPAASSTAARARPAWRGGAETVLVESIHPLAAETVQETTYTRL
jgi:hypothetical protein